MLLLLSLVVDEFAALLTRLVPAVLGHSPWSPIRAGTPIQRIKALTKELGVRACA